MNFLLDLSKTSRQNEKWTLFILVQNPNGTRRPRQILLIRGDLLFQVLDFSKDDFLVLFCFYFSPHKELIQRMAYLEKSNRYLVVSKVFLCPLYMIVSGSLTHSRFCLVCAAFPPVSSRFFVLFLKLLWTMKPEKFSSVCVKHNMNNRHIWLFMCSWDTFSGGWVDAAVLQSGSNAQNFWMSFWISSAHKLSWGRQWQSFVTVVWHLYFSYQVWNTGTARWLWCPKPRPVPQPTSQDWSKESRTAQMCGGSQFSLSLAFKSLALCLMYPLQIRSRCLCLKTTEAVSCRVHVQLCNASTPEWQLNPGRLQYEHFVSHVILPCAGTTLCLKPNQKNENVDKNGGATLAVVAECALWSDWTFWTGV